MDTPTAPTHEEYDPECDYAPVLIDGADAENAGIMGGDLLFCPRCKWYGRPNPAAGS